MSTPPGPPQDPSDPRYGQQPPPGYPGTPPQGYPQPGYPGTPPQGYPAQGYPPPGYGPPQPLPGDPLVPADLSGWFERIIGVAKRSFVPLLQIQIGLTVVSAIFSIVINSYTAGFVESAANPGAGAPSGLGTFFVVIIVGFVVLMVASAFAIGASIYIALRQANGESATLAEGLSFAAGRALPLIGWGILAILMILVGTLFLVLPGIYLAIVFTASLYGIVVVERGNIGRCFTLVNPRFLPTTGRLVLASLIVFVYVVVVGFISAVFGQATVAATIVQSVLFIPVGIVFSALALVTYAELRFHDRERPGALTPNLAAELRS